jgi:hypothetical protein
VNQIDGRGGRWAGVGIAFALGFVAAGSVAIGALAIRRLAIRQLAVDRAALKSLTIGTLTVKHLRAGDVTVSGSLELPPASAPPDRR